MVDTLSQNEIDALLSALNTGGGGGAAADKPAPAAGSAAPSGGGEEPVKPAKGERDKQKKGKVYDFKRQTKFSKEQLGTIQLIHETFARLIGTDLSTQLRAYAQATIISVDQLTFEELIRSIYSPTFITAFKSERLDGKGLIDINLNVVFTILDRLLGGNGTPLGTLRQLTDVEKQIMHKLMNRIILERLREAWINVIDLSPSIELIESNPQFAQIVPPNDMVLSVVIEIKIHDVTGIMTLCIPYNTVESIAAKFNAASWFAAVRKEPLTTNYDAITSQVKAVNLPFVAELGTQTVTLQDILTLQVGDLLVLDQLVKEDLNVRVGNRVKFRGRPGIVGKKMAVSITQLLSSHEEDEL
ncbi:MAG TPA: flagellar motor switch protein FliM [Candidatus Ozemobacteraceae bacterium]